MNVTKVYESVAAITVDPKEIATLRLGLRALLRNLNAEKDLPDQDQEGIAIAIKKAENMLTQLSTVVLHY